MMQSTADRKVSVIGLDAMGPDTAKALHNHGYTVYVYGAHPGTAADFAKEGDVACATPAKVAAGMDVVISIVVNVAQTETVLFGEAGAVDAMRRGNTFVIRPTVGPNWSIALEVRLAQQDILYVDGPVSSGAAEAVSGQITMVTSAAPEAYAAASDVLDAMAGKVYHLDDKAGASSKVKIINQLLAGVHIAAATEAMALGLREGVVTDALYEIITHSADNSWTFGNRMARVLVGDYTPLSTVDIFVKDLRFVLNTARASKFPLPLAATAHQMFMQASTAGYAREDDSAMVKTFLGVTLPESQLR